MCSLLAAVTGDAALTGDRIVLCSPSTKPAWAPSDTAVSRPTPRPRLPHPDPGEVAATYADPAATAPGAGPPGSWVRPVTTGLVTSGFGHRWGRLHAGVDIGVPVDTPVYAASAGTVLAGGYGQWVKLAYPGGITTVYGHISRWTVTPGRAIQTGQLIAYSGNEGRSTGPTCTSRRDPVTNHRSHHVYAAHGTRL